MIKKYPIPGRDSYEVDGREISRVEKIMLQNAGLDEDSAIKRVLREYVEPGILAENAAMKTLLEKAHDLFHEILGRGKKTPD